MRIHPSREIEITYSIMQGHFCSYDLPLPYSTTWLSSTMVFSLGYQPRSSNAEGEGSGLGDETHLWIVESQPGRMHGKGDSARLPGARARRANRAVCARTGDRGDQVATVELHHLVTCLLSCIEYSIDTSIGSVVFFACT